MNKLETFTNQTDFALRQRELLKSNVSFDTHYDPDKKIYTIQVMEVSHE